MPATEGTGIAYASAVDAAHMLMPGDITIESFGRPGSFKPAYLTGIRQEVKVAVYRAKADAGQTFADDAVQLIRCGVGFDFSQFFKDDSTLPSHSGLWLGHKRTPVFNKNYYLKRLLSSYGIKEKTFSVYFPAKPAKWPDP